MLVCQDCLTSGNLTYKQFGNGNAMKKVAFVVQRYGTEVNGGAETLARQLAMQLSKNYDVDILTTKALDYITWEDYYEKDCEVIDGVNVKRFSVDKTRDIKKFSKLCKKVLDNETHILEQEQAWFDEQGPFTPKLIQYIKDNKESINTSVQVSFVDNTLIKSEQNKKENKKKNRR